jgi:hypothetical protein
VPRHYMDKLVLSSAPRTLLPRRRGESRREAGFGRAVTLSAVPGDHGHRRTKMKLTKNGLETMAGPSDWFAGNVYADVVSTPSPTSRVMGGIVHFTPGSRTAWHTHLVS